MTVTVHEGRWLTCIGGLFLCAHCGEMLVASAEEPVWRFWPTDTPGTSTMTICATCAAGRES